MEQSLDTNAARRFERWPHLVLLITLVCTLAATAILMRFAHASRVARFQRHVDSARMQISARLNTYGSILRGVDGFFRNEGIPPFPRFHDYVKALQIEENYPGILGLGFSMAVPPGQEQLATELGKSTISDFKIWPTTSSSERQTILFLEPMHQRNRAAIGFDMSSEPIRRAAIVRAKADRRPTASGSVVLVQEIDTHKQNGFLIYHPIFENARPGEKEGTELIGYVYSPFRAGDFLSAIARDLNLPGLGIELRDAPISHGEKSKVLASIEPSVTHRVSLQETTSFQAANREWGLKVYGNPEFADGLWEFSQMFVLCGGLIASGILYAGSNMLVNARILADERATEARKASEAKDEFLAKLSHELRTPLTPVLASLSSVDDEFDIPPPLARDLAMIRRNVELEARLIDDLLDLTRITNGKLELHTERISLRRIVEDAINTCAPDLKAKNISVVRELDTSDLVIRADGARITQVLWNLLRNAVKFTDSGGTLTIRILRLDLLQHGRQVRVEVEDNGIGIEPQQLARVFEAFEQGDRKITRKFGGLGLGLAISKAIAELHEGSLSASSAGLGKGSQFVLTLPYEADDCSESADSLKLPKVPFQEVPPLRILLVEDHADSAAILLRFLRRMGHEVFHAGTVAGGSEIFRREMAIQRLDLVISDLGLPDASGLDLMREIAGLGVPGIALSGYGMESDLEQSSAAGFACHLTKPLDIDLLKRTIAEVIAAPASS